MFDFENIPHGHIQSIRYVSQTLDGCIGRASLDFAYMLYAYAGFFSELILREPFGGAQGKNLWCF